MKNSKRRKARPVAKPRGNGKSPVKFSTQSAGPQALLVLGMHRSGTSAVTRVFNLLGADLPKNLMGAGPTNEAGHWESLDLFVLHDQLLASAGSRWDDWRKFNSDWMKSGIADRYRDKLLDILRADFGSSALFVVKDPRICRFVPLWLDLLDRFGAAPRIVIPVRNPMETAASLKKRDGFPLSKSYLLWLRHVLDAEHATRGLPRIIFNFDALLNDWRGIVQTTTTRTGVYWPRRSDLSELEIDEFLADALRHHTADQAQLAARADVAGWVKETYRVLYLMGNGPERAVQFERLDRIRMEFDAACATFGLVLTAEAERSETQVRSMEARAKAQETEIERLSSELTQARSGAEQAQAAVAASQSHAAALAAELEAARIAAQERAAALATELERARAAVREHASAVAAGERMIAEIGAQLAAARTKVEQQQHELEDIKADLDSTRSLANDRKNEVEALSRELAVERAAAQDSGFEIERLTRDLEATRRLLREGQSEIQRLAGERDTARIEAEQAQDEARHVLKATRDEIASLEKALAHTRDVIDRKDMKIDDLSRELQLSVEQLGRIEQVLDQGAPNVAGAGGAEALARELRARVNATAAEKTRLAAELARAEAQMRHLEAVTAQRTAEIESTAQARMHALHAKLVDTEAELAKTNQDRRKGLPWTKLLRSRRAARQLVDSALFDAEWYVREYPDVVRNGRSPVHHFLEEGYLRGYRPNPLFDTRWYLERYEDVRRAGINPLLHYATDGFREGRDPGPEFQTTFYLEANPDVRSTGMNPLTHYLRHGRHEGRLPTPPD